MIDLSQMRRAVDRKVADYNAARARFRDEFNALQDATEKLAAQKEALVLAQGVAQQVQEMAHAKIANVVSKSLQAVFEQAYQFKIKFEQKRGRTEASLMFLRNGVELEDAIFQVGGGVLAVAAFALRISCLMLQSPACRRLLVLDEPFVHLSQQYRSRVRDLVQELATEFGFQMLLVTHVEELQMGEVVQV